MNKGTFAEKISVDPLSLDVPKITDVSIPDALDDLISLDYNPRTEAHNSNNTLKQIDQELVSNNSTVFVEQLKGTVTGVSSEFVEVKLRYIDRDDKYQMPLCLFDFENLHVGANVVYSVTIMPNGTRTQSISRLEDSGTSKNLADLKEIFSKTRKKV